jgi:hypothetical protein
MGSVSWSTNNEGKVFALFLSVPAERPDFRSLLGKCGTIEYQGDTFTVSPLPLPGLPVGPPHTALTWEEFTTLA